MFCISLKSVCKVFRNGGADLRALDSVSLDFASCGFYFITGKSGSGKSTLLNVIGGLEAPTSGSVETSKGARFAYVFQDENFVFALSAMDNLRLVCLDQAKILKAVDSVGLSDKMGTAVSLLSKGERARFAIAKALVSGASAILLDEPTGNLDSENSDRVFSLLKSLSSSILVVAVTHDRESAERYGDVVVTLSDGKIASIQGKAPEGAERAKIPTAAPIRSVPRDIALKYSFKKAFSRKGKMILSVVNLTLSSALLVVGLSAAMLDRGGLISKATASSPAEYYGVTEKIYDSTGQQCLFTGGARLRDELEAAEAKPYVEAEFAYGSDGKNSLSVTAESLSGSGEPSGIADGSVAISDYVAEKRGLSVGNVLTSWKGLALTVSSIYATEWPSISANYDATEALKIGWTNCSRCFVSDATFDEIQRGNFWYLADYLSPNGSEGNSKSYKEWNSSLTLAAGRAPVASNEIAVSSGYVENDWPGGDTSKVLGKEFAVSDVATDEVPLERYVSRLKVVGIFDDSTGGYFSASSAFFDAISEGIRYGAYGTFFTIRASDARKLAGLLRRGTLLETGGLELSCGALENPITGALLVWDTLDSTRVPLLVATATFLALAASSLLLYCLDAIKTSEKDIALLKLSGKSDLSIASVFLLMNGYLALLSFALSLALGIPGLYWLGYAMEGGFGVTFNPLFPSWWAILASAAALALIPLMVSLLSIGKVKNKDAATIFKRNLV